MYHTATRKCTGKCQEKTYNVKLPKILLLTEFYTPVALAVLIVGDWALGLYFSSF
jgi:hypothetical protein